MPAALAWLDAQIELAEPARAILQGNSGSHDCRSRHAARIAIEPAHRAAINEMMKVWIATGRLPRAALDAALMAWDRLIEARGFCAWAAACGFQIPCVSPEQLLELLLIEYWTVAGVHRWRAREFPD